jgi:hypothetical protein
MYRLLVRIYYPLPHPLLVASSCPPRSRSLLMLHSPIVKFTSWSVRTSHDNAVPSNLTEPKEEETKKPCWRALTAQ